MSDLPPVERAALLDGGMARDQEVGICRHDHCLHLDRGGPPPCSLCAYLVTGRVFLAAWRQEERRREQTLKELAMKPGTEVLAAQLKGQFEQFQRNLTWVLAEPEEEMNDRPPSVR